MCSHKGSAAFRQWFSNSKVITAKGEPLQVYHGTAIDKTSFRRDGGASGVGAYFTSNAAVASDYAEMDGSVDGDPSFVVPVYLSLQNPYFSEPDESHSISPEFRKMLEDQGYDGVITQYDDGTEYVAFSPNQIKSSTGNNGNFDPQEQNICF